MNRPRNTPDNWKEIVQELKEAFDRSGMTQDELADKTGLIQSNISRIFNFKFIPRISTIALIADAIGVELVILDKIKDKLK